MGLDLEAFTQKRKNGLPCSVAAALQALDPAERAVFEEAMALPKETVQHARVEELFAARGFRVGQQVGRHRRRQCGCFD